MAVDTTKKTLKNSHFKDLLLLFSIPLGIAVFAAVVIYVPILFANPKSDFIYSNCDDYRCNTSYSVDPAGNISQDYPITVRPDYSNLTSSLRYYDASTDSTRGLTLEQAKAYQLNTSSKSPDGYTLTRENSGGGFFFSGDTYNGWYLKNGAKKKKVELTTNGSYYSSEIKLLGWVIE